MVDMKNMEISHHLITIEEEMNIAVVTLENLGSAMGIITKTGGEKEDEERVGNAVHFRNMMIAVTVEDEDVTIIVEDKMNTAGKNVVD
jgi:hypothetical protein